MIFPHTVSIILKGLAAVAQNINDAVSSTVITVIGIVAAGAILGAVSWAWNMSDQMGEVKSDIAVIKYMVTHQGQQSTAQGGSNGGGSSGPHQQPDR